MLCAMWRAKGTECSGHHRQSGLEPKGGSVRAYTPKVWAARARGELPEKWGGGLTQAVTSVGTSSWSFAGVV